MTSAMKKINKARLGRGETDYWHEHIGHSEETKRFSTGGPHEFLKHATPDHLVRGTELFTLRLRNLKHEDTNTTIKIIPIFFVRLAKNVFFGMPQNFSS